MVKRRYRAVSVKDVNISSLVSVWVGELVVFGIDVAKYDFYCAVMDERGQVARTVKWKHPEESGVFLRFVREFREHGLS